MAGPLLVLLAGFEFALRLVEQKWFGALSRLVTIAVLIALLWPFWRALLHAPPERPGVAMERAEFPRLWRLVDEAAAMADVATVSEQLVSDDVAVVARCDGKWLGPRWGRWRLRLGAGAVSACPADGLRLAIAAELAGWRTPGARLRRTALPSAEVRAVLAEADLVATSRWALGAFHRAVRPVVRGCVLAGDAAVARDRRGGQRHRRAVAHPRLLERRAPARPGRQRLTGARAPARPPRCRWRGGYARARARTARTARSTTR
ncbi:M48 family metalloprotease [Salinifilum aidingensis]